MDNRSLPEASSLHDVSLLKNSSQVDSTTLPEEVWLIIAGFLPPKKRRKLGKISSMFARIKNELEQGEQIKYSNFILNNLSECSLKQAQEFLDDFWQTTYYYSLRKKCILTPEELTPEEVFCFLLTRKGNEPALYAKLHKKLTYELAISHKSLNRPTLEHLNIIQLAFTISIHITNALAKEDAQRLAAIGCLQGNQQTITLENLPDRLIDIYASKHKHIHISANAKKINLLAEPEELLKELKKLMNENPSHPIFKSMVAYHGSLLYALNYLLRERINIKWHLNLSGINFSNKVIEGLKFDNVCLNYSRFNNAKLKSTTFRNATLEQVDLSNTILNDCDFTKGFLFNVNFSGSTLKNLIFSKSHLYMVDFINAKGRGSTFKDAVFFSSNTLSLVELRNEYNQIKRNIEYLVSSNDFGQTILTLQYSENIFYFPLLQNISKNLMAMQEVTCAEKLLFLNQVKKDFGYTSSWRERFFSMAPHPDSFLGMIDKIESVIREQNNNTYFQQFSSFFMPYHG